MIDMIEKLKIDYDRVAESYAKQLCESWDLSYGYWVGDEPGGLYCFNDAESINYGDMVYCVNESIPFETYLDWSEYNTEANEFGFNFINLKSWVKGCPRVPQETFKKLRDMKSELEQLINEEKKKYD